MYRGDGSQPDGYFFLNEQLTKQATAAEVLGIYKGREGSTLADYLRTYFLRTWAHFDASKVGRVGVEILPQFMRFLASDQTVNLQWGLKFILRIRYLWMVRLRNQEGFQFDPFVF